MQVNVFLDCMNIEWKVSIHILFYIYQLIFLNGELIHFILRCLLIWPVLETQLFNTFLKMVILFIHILNCQSKIHHLSFTKVTFKI